MKKYFFIVPFMALASLVLMFMMQAEWSLYAPKIFGATSEISLVQAYTYTFLSSLVTFIVCDVVRWKLS